ncbi:YkgJ family cysteine cluster protein [Methanofollis aquaemaris]|uniref:YkgJ family cysteine cluster protein n=1 Tax=Methanofollis aquaemaris TaxID=126734 RepID=A0A8A3S7I4_9EURY|nr:YkgJ family cysteine cluster protein [Methanofollis aquaemaris]QSZ67992.1 YkgJ family cysteine cluster protein [Methanofollis aquaemaris]
MRGVDDLTGEIRERGFRCTRCGACCSEVSEGSNLVILSPGEVRQVAKAADLPPGEVAEPYPEFLDGPGKSRYTFDWCLNRDEGHCRFLEGEKCRVYAARPWICRTYPFMLEGDRLIVSECPGLGTEMTLEEARAVASALIERQAAEAAEEEGIRRVLSTTSPPPGETAVVDSEGVWPVHG